MKGKYITTALKLAVRSNNEISINLTVAETTAQLNNFQIMWQKQNSKPDELKVLSHKKLSLSAA
jgi:hypothetical protein